VAIAILAVWPAGSLFALAVILFNIRGAVARHQPSNISTATKVKPYIYIYVYIYIYIEREREMYVRVCMYDLVFQVTWATRTATGGIYIYIHSIVIVVYMCV